MMKRIGKVQHILEHNNNWIKSKHKLGGLKGKHKGRVEKDVQVMGTFFAICVTLWSLLIKALSVLCLGSVSH